MKTKVVALFAILSLGLFSCQDINSVATTESATEDIVLKSAEVAVSDITIESVMEEISHETEMFTESEILLRKLARFSGKRLSGKWWKRYNNDESVVVTIDTSETRYPMTITLDYGEGTELKNGRVISGTVQIEISAEKNTDGATRTVNYNCTMDTITAVGTSVQTFSGDNETTKTTTSSSDITFTLSDGTVIERTGNHTRNWIEGVGTTEREDDIIEVTGSTNLESSNGDTWSKTITQTLVRDGACNYYVQGIVEIVYNEEVSSIMNYGDGECDNIAILTVDGEDVEIELKEKRAKIDDRNKEKKDKKGNS